MVIGIVGVVLLGMIWMSVVVGLGLGLELVSLLPPSLSVYVCVCIIPFYVNLCFSQ